MEVVTLILGVISALASVASAVIAVLGFMGFGRGSSGSDRTIARAPVPPLLYVAAALGFASVAYSLLR